MKKLILVVIVVVAGVSLEAFVLAHRSRRPVKDAAAVMPVEAPAAMPAPPAEVVPVPQTAVQRPDLELLGTLTNGKFPVAFIKDTRSGASGIYKVGSVMQGWLLVEISPGKVALDSDGTKAFFSLSGRAQPASRPAPGFIESAADGTLLVKTGELARDRKEVLRELKKVRLTPQVENKKVSGLRVEGIGDNSVITCAGIRNNDVIREVNDQRIDSYQKALQVLAKARNRPDIRVSLTREGQFRQISYRLE